MIDLFLYVFLRDFRIYIYIYKQDDCYFSKCLDISQDLIGHFQISHLINENFFQIINTQWNYEED